ncbi:CopG family ribbon-helix-helix protein [uncultured Devosia sp.]|uniref:CopG family ribbon-helix-helix protein n=1 Tax=uncultured Devosia sp. TaxID=211434 RepID=UPI0035CC347E
MTITLDIPDDLKARIDVIAARSSLSAAEVVADALENGHSIEWQERFLDKIAQGIDAADKGEFASPADLARVVNKYRASVAAKLA